MDVISSYVDIFLCLKHDSFHCSRPVIDYSGLICSIVINSFFAVYATGSPARLYIIEELNCKYNSMHVYLFIKNKKKVCTYGKYVYIEKTK